jgi:hypothetical protein
MLHVILLCTVSTAFDYTYVSVSTSQRDCADAFAVGRFLQVTILLYLHQRLGGTVLLHVLSVEFCL